MPITDDMSRHIKAQRCECCGRGAMVLVQDTAEQDPQQAPSGDWFIKVAACGKPHYYCLSHQRESVRHPRFRSEQEAADWIRSKLEEKQRASEVKEKSS